MQQDGGGNAGQQQQPQQGGGGGGGAGGIGGPPGQMTAAQQAQYRATLLQQQQIQAMQAAMRAQQQRNNANGQMQGQQQPSTPAQQQQQFQQMARPMQNQQQAGQQRPLQQGGNANGVQAAQLQALQQLFQNNPEQLAMFVNMSKDGKLTPDQLNQLRGAVTAVQQQHQQQQQMQQMQQQQQQGGRPPAQNQQPRPVQPPQQQQVNQQQQIRPASGPQQGQAQGQAGSNAARPPVVSAAAQDIQAKMMAIQKQAEPIIQKLKELEGALTRPPAQGGLAAGTPDRQRLEKESRELKAQQNKLAVQFMAHKVQYLLEIGQPQQAQQVQQQMAMQQRAAAQQAAAAAAAAASATANGGQTQGQSQPAIANQNRAAATPPQHNVRPPAGNANRASQDQIQNSRPATPSAGVAQAGSTAKGSPNVQGKANMTASSPQYQHPQVPPEAMAQRSNMMSGPSNASSMAGGSGQGPFGPGIAAQLNVQPSVPEPYPNNHGPRPTLNQGLGTNPTLGTPAILQRPDPLTGNTSATSTGGGVAASGAGTANWEELLGLATKESKSGLSNLTASELETVMADPSHPDFWDAVTGKGTGADTLTNAGAVTTNAASTASLNNPDGRILTKRKVQELVAEIDANERLEGDVEDLLLEIADEFIDSVTHFSCKLAKHRKGDRLEVRDVQLHLERSWNLRIPTPGSVPIPPPRIKATAQQSGGGAKANANNNTSAVTS